MRWTARSKSIAEAHAFFVRLAASCSTIQFGLGKQQLSVGEVVLAETVGGLKFAGVVLVPTLQIRIVEGFLGHSRSPRWRKC